MDEPFTSVAGVNALWCSLAAWCDRKRLAGQPYRRVQLPSPGTATLIGRAVKIAFPSWSDRSALTQALRGIPVAVRRSPSRLVQELARPRYAFALSPAVATAFRDFERALRDRRHMLLGHRFWRLVESIDARLAQVEEGGRNARWRLELRFGGYELDIVRASLFRAEGVRTGVVAWEGALQELETLPRTALPMTLATALDQGVLIANETPGLVWTVADEGPSPDSTAIVLSRRGSVVSTSSLNTAWRALEGDWSASTRLSESDLAGLRRQLGLALPEAMRLADLSFDGGIRTDRTSWLGRPGFLPLVQASASSQLSLQPVAGAVGVLGLEQRGSQWKLLADRPLAGRWRVVASESGAETEKVICFDHDAREHWDFPDILSSLELEREAAGAPRPRQAARTRPCTSGHLPPALDHALEAVYAGPARGWSEGHLVRALMPAMPHDHFVWDFVRALAEAEWLDPFVLRSWRARIWRLRPPSLRQGESGWITAAGAIGAMPRRRLGDAVAALGGEVRVVMGGSAWAPPILQIEGVDIHQLAEVMNWPISQEPFMRFEPAPRCWPLEARSGQGRQLHAIWSFEAGLFLPPIGDPSNQSVRLERLVRERGDDRDVYRVVDRDNAFITASRTVAILEAHRLKRRPLFRWEGGQLRRLTRSGHLPLEMARALARASGAASGPVAAADGVWSYHYPADIRDAEQIARCLGSAVDLGGARRTDPLRDVVAARRSGSRRTWIDQRIAGGSM